MKNDEQLNFNPCDKILIYNSLHYFHDFDRDFFCKENTIGR